MRALALAVVLACAVLAPTCSAQSPAEMYAALPHLGATQPLRPLITPPALLPSTPLLTTLTPPSPPAAPQPRSYIHRNNHPLRNAIDNLREIALARFSLGRRVGTGASENVYEGSIDCSRRVAVLRMKRGAASLDEEACMLLKLSRHANLVRSWVTCNQGGEPLIVTELAHHGSVLSHGGGTR